MNKIIKNLVDDLMGAKLIPCIVEGQETTLSILDHINNKTSHKYDEEALYNAATDIVQAIIEQEQYSDIGELVIVEKLKNDMRLTVDNVKNWATAIKLQLELHAWSS